jgi:hypothetical protein
MIRQCRVTIFARIVDAAALHFDRDNVGRPVVMPAASLGVEIDAAYIGNVGNHRDD